jgi:hypothetical protein
VLLYWMVTFASASSTLNQELKNFAGMHRGALSLWEIALCRYQTSHSEYKLRNVGHDYNDKFVIMVAIFLLHLLIAQPIGACRSPTRTWWAMLVRIMLQPLSQAVEQFSEMRWTRSHFTLELEERLEFGMAIALPGDLKVHISSGYDETLVTSTAAMWSSWWQSPCCTRLSLSSVELARSSTRLCLPEWMLLVGRPGSLRQLRYSYLNTDAGRRYENGHTGSELPVPGA